MDPDAKPVVTVVPAVSLVRLDVRNGFSDLDVVDLIDQCLQERPDQHAGVRSSKAQVGAEAKGEMRVGFAVEADFLGVLEDGFIVVG